jgi:HD-like signal output (HDOD) protein
LTSKLTGRLEVFGFADLLQWMELNRRTGRLTLEHGRDRRILDWREGQIVYVSGSQPRHRLGVHLLRSGALQAAALYELLARNFTSQENLTRLILDGGHDTLDGLSLRVEELARKLLFETFEWKEARFEYDPDFRVQPILRIGLSLRGQALAFEGVKTLDDNTRRRRRSTAASEAAAPTLPFDPAEADERFWEILERIGTPVHPEEARAAHRQFLEFTHLLRDRIARHVVMHPVHEDTAELLLQILKKSPVDVSAVIPVAALDPYLSLDLLILANALSVDRDNSVGTAPDAVHRVGARAVTVLVDRLSGPDFPRIAESDKPARVLRRAAVAAAVAAGRYAERYSITRERGYTLGLLHTIAYAEMLEILREIEFPSGPFRAAALETFRPAMGSALAESWGLPLDFESVISDEGGEPSAAAALVRTSRATIPSCAIGSVSGEPVEPMWTDEIAQEVNVVFDFLGLEAVEVKTS